MVQEPRACFPLTLELTGANLPKRSWVRISQIGRLSVKRLGKKLGRVSVEEPDQVIEGLNEMIASWLTGKRCLTQSEPTIAIIAALETCGQITPSLTDPPPVTISACL